MEVEVAREGREANGGETRPRRLQRVLRQAVRAVVVRRRAHVHVAADAVARLAAHQVVYRDAQPLALDVPQRDVYRRQRPLHNRPHEVRAAVEPLVVMFDLVRVLAEQIRLHRLDHRLRRALPAVNAALANAERPVLAVDFYQQPAVPEDRLDLLYLRGLWHVVISLRARTRADARRAELARVTLSLALSRKGRGDLSLAIRAWFLLNIRFPQSHSPIAPSYSSSRVTRAISAGDAVLSASSDGCAPSRSAFRVS